MANADTDALGYEQARDELIEVVRRLEAGGSTLEESLALWERGEQLAKVCHRWLEGARARLDAALAAEQSAGAPPLSGEAAEETEEAEEEEEEEEKYEDYGQVGPAAIGDAEDTEGGEAEDGEGPEGRT